MSDYERRKWTKLKNAYTVNDVNAKRVHMGCMDATGTFGPGMEDFFNKYIAAVIPNPKWRQGHAEENKTLKGAAKAVAVFRRRGRIASAARSNRAYKIIRLIERVRQAAFRDGADLV